MDAAACRYGNETVWGSVSSVASMLTALALDVEHPAKMALAVLGSVLMWMDLYLLLQTVSPHCSSEWNCRVVTFIHACIVTVLALTSSFVIGPWPFTHLGQPCSTLHTTIVLLSLGYFLFDFGWCMLSMTEGLVMLAHHVVSIYGLGYVLFWDKYGSEVTATLGCSELTNPLLQVRWFMKQRGVYTGIRAAGMDWVFVWLFLSARLGLGSPFLVTVLLSAEVDDLIPKLGACVFYVISAVFSFQLLKFMTEKYLRN